MIAALNTIQYTKKKINISIEGVLKIFQWHLEQKLNTDKHRYEEKKNNQESVGYAETREERAHFLNIQEVGTQELKAAYFGIKMDASG